MNELRIELGENGYAIHVGKGLLSMAGSFFNLDRRVLIVTDSGVPAEYAKAILGQCRDGRILTVPEGEGSKSLEGFYRVLSEMGAMRMGRGDCAVAVGGGVVGDLTGFAAACYMRGIDFYNVPTTLLSQVDSSIGGKTAINLDGIKNIVGAFHQPKGVLIDTDTLRTLDRRMISNGLAEAIKMSLTGDAELFGLFEELDRDEMEERIEEIIVRSLMIKKTVVEADERESGLRRVLNFGHTIGHGIEAAEAMNGLYHGECVAIGMIPMCGEELRPRVRRVLEKVSLPHEYRGDSESILEPALHDKKFDKGGVSVVFVDSPGEFRIEKISQEELGALIDSMNKNDQ